MVDGVLPPQVEDLETGEGHVDAALVVVLVLQQAVAHLLEQGGDGRHLGAVDGPVVHQELDGLVHLQQVEVLAADLEVGYLNLVRVRVDQAHSEPLVGLEVVARRLDASLMAYPWYLNVIFERY